MSLVALCCLACSCVEARPVRRSLPDTAAINRWTLLGSWDQSCMRDSDCMLATEGDVCGVALSCTAKKDIAISRRDEQKWLSADAMIDCAQAPHSDAHTRTMCLRAVDTRCVAQRCAVVMGAQPGGVESVATAGVSGNRLGINIDELLEDFRGMIARAELQSARGAYDDADATYAAFFAKHLAGDRDVDHSFAAKLPPFGSLTHDEDVALRVCRRVASMAKANRASERAWQGARDHRALMRELFAIDWQTVDAADAELVRVGVFAVAHDEKARAAIAALSPLRLTISWRAPPSTRVAKAALDDLTLRFGAALARHAHDLGIDASLTNDTAVGSVALDWSTSERGDVVTLHSDCARLPSVRSRCSASARIDDLTGERDAADAADALATSTLAALLVSRLR